MSILSFLDDGHEQIDIIMLNSLLEDGHGLVPFETWGKRSSKKTSQTVFHWDQRTSSKVRDTLF